MPASRDAVRQLLSMCRISSLDGVTATIKALMKNLRRFALDRKSIQRLVESLSDIFKHYVCFRFFFEISFYWKVFAVNLWRSFKLKNCLK